MKKQISLFFATAVFAITGLTSCGNNPTGPDYSDMNTPITPGFKVDKQYVYGMDDIYWQEHQWDGISYTYEHKLFEALGVKSIRFWAHQTFVLKNPTTVDDKGYAVARAAFDQIKNKGYQIIGMSHASFKTMYKGQTGWDKGTYKPPRDLTPGSKYMQWLEDYGTGWETLVGLFPEIEYWEIDNETNNVDFMGRVGGGKFSLEEMAEITYDMQYVASRAIHKVNPSAKTVMGGLVCWGGPETYLESLYDCIETGPWESHDPDDYFQVACWHPYLDSFTKKKFKTMNDSCYEVVRRREKKDKKVFLTEAGFNDNWYNMNPTKAATYIKEMYEVLRDSMYYVESCHLYRMWDLDTAFYGLFADPTEIRAETKDTYKRGEAKPAAYAYQTVAGGKGDLNVYRDYIETNGTHVYDPNDPRTE